MPKTEKKKNPHPGESPTYGGHKPESLRAEVGTPRALANQGEVGRSREWKNMGF